MRNRNFISINWVTVSFRDGFRRSDVTNELMPIKIIVNPFISFASTAFLTLQELTVKSFGLKNIDGWNGQMKRWYFWHFLRIVYDLQIMGKLSLGNNIAMDQREQEIRRHQQRFRKWNSELNNQQKSPNFIGKPEDNAYKYAINLIQKLQSGNLKPTGLINKENAQQAESECESNICCICLEMMVPPSIPYVLFPCGHNICKICLFVDGDKKRDVYKLRINKCPQCKVIITNQSENKNLMQLICTYTNNKHLLKEEIDNQMSDQSNQDNLMKLKAKCQILEGEKKVLRKEIEKFRGEKKVLYEVIDRLHQERRRNQQELDVLDEEGRLISKHVLDKKEEIDKLKAKIQEAEQQKRVICNSLEPLTAQKQKAEMKHAKKLLSSK